MDVDVEDGVGDGREGEWLRFVVEMGELQLPIWVIFGIRIARGRCGCRCLYPCYCLFSCSVIKQTSAFCADGELTHDRTVSWPRWVSLNVGLVTHRSCCKVRGFNLARSRIELGGVGIYGLGTRSQNTNLIILAT